MIPCSRPELSGLYTLSQSKLLENHTLHSGTYLYRAYMAEPPPPPPRPDVDRIVLKGLKHLIASNTHTTPKLVSFNIPYVFISDDHKWHACRQYDNLHKVFNCQRGNRAKTRGCLGGRIITPRNVGKNSQILRHPLKFAFLTIFGCK